MIFLKVLVLAAVAAAEQVRFDGYQVVRVVPKNPVQLSALHDLRQHPGELDFWTPVVSVNIPVDISIPPKRSYEFEAWARLHRLEKRIFIDDLQHAIDNGRSKAGKKPEPGNFDWDDYYDLDVMSCGSRSRAVVNQNFIPVAVVILVTRWL